jgi:hypothetical protein
MAPGPASNGNARGTTPDSPPDELSESGIRLLAVSVDFFLIFVIVLGLPRVHSPRVSNSIATMNKRMPPAIMKLEMVIPNILKIVVPAIANTSNKIPVVITALEEITLRSWFEMFLVSETYKGITPIGSITTNKAIVDVRSSCIFMLLIECRDVEAINEIDEGKERE